MKLLLILLLFIILFISGVRYMEKSSLFFPMRELTITPAIVGLKYEEVYFNTFDNKKLHGWFIANDSARFTVIFAHGNAGNIGHRVEKIKLLYDIGVSVFIFDYRGYGRSEGAASEAGLYRDTEAAYDYIVKIRKIPEDSVILYGESIGGAPVIDLARKARVRALITEEAFSSIKDMARTAYPILPAFIFSSRFDSLSKIPEVECPKLIIHSVDDEIVPLSLGEKLYAAANPPKQFLKIRGSHNTAFFDSQDVFTREVKAWIAKL